MRSCFGVSILLLEIDKLDKSEYRCSKEIAVRPSVDGSNQDMAFNPVSVLC